MVSSEIRDTAMIAVSAMLLASLLGFISFLTGVRGDFAEARNDQIYAKEALAHHNEFNKYTDGTELYGGDVIAAIRDYYDTGIKVAVKRGNTIVYQIDKATARQFPNNVTTAYLTARIPVDKKYSAVIVNTPDPITAITSTYKNPDNSGYTVQYLVFFEK